MLFSIVIPLYNRPEEIDELLASLLLQTVKEFEVIVVEDGSTKTSEHIAMKYSNLLKIKYLFKSNSGPGLSRNYGAESSLGKYLIFLDSDCVLPLGYLEEVVKELDQNVVDAFGGPDRADRSFSKIQKAINYSMTSFITTGGIRGSRKQMDRYYPRSFNMGVKKTVFDSLGGFSKMRFGEDIDFSTRIYEAGFTCMLFPDAWVYHKRRTDFKKFFKQVYNSGIARVVMVKKRPHTLRLVYLLPALFTLGCVFTLIASVFAPILLSLFLLFSGLIFVDSALRTKSLYIGVLSILASFIQLVGYGSGFLVALWKICFLGQKRYIAFQKSFYD